MSELVERVARALFDAGDVPGDWEDLGDGPTDLHYKALYLRMATDAILEMRECNEAMLRAFWDKSSSPDFYPDDSRGSEWYGDTDDFKKGWAAAIDEALKPAQ